MTTIQKKYPTISASFGLVGILILIFILTCIPFEVIRFLLKKYSHLDRGLTKSVAFFFEYLITMISIFWIGINRFRSRNLIDYKLKFNTISITNVVIVFITALAAIFLLHNISVLIPMPEIIKKMFEKIMKPNIFSFLAAVIAAPILEEIFFRGIILEGLLKNYSPQKSIIWSSVIFGISHLNPWQALPTMFAGVFIGWIYWKSNSLIPGILIHLLNNLIAFSAIVFSNKNSEPFIQISDNKIIYFTFMLVSLIILVVGLKVLNKRFKIITPNVVVHL